jgi:uncharacterized protein DUF1097
MNAMTARALSIAVAVAVWTAISHLAKLPLQLWPVIVGLACFLAAGGGIPGLKRSVLGTASGVAWTLIAVAVSRALGGQPIIDALVLGAAAFGIVYQARFPLLTFTAGAIAGLGVGMGTGVVNLEGGIKVAVALAIGTGLGYGAEYLAGMMKGKG